MVYGLEVKGEGFDFIKQYLKTNYFLYIDVQQNYSDRKEFTEIK